MALHTYSQFRATLALATGVLLVLIFNTFYDKYQLSLPVSQACLEQDKRLLDSIFQQISYQELPDGHFSEEREAPPGQDAADLKLHRFNLNKIEKSEWLSMGLPEKVFNGLERYRSKGGRFRRPEDVKKLYSLSEELADRLLPYIQTDSNRKSRFTSENQSFTKKPKGPRPLFNLNEADSSDLDGVFGIGGKTALRILKYRDALGGFHSMNQLFEIWKLDTLVIEELQLRSFIPDPPGLKKIAINSVSEEDLAIHPYVRSNLARVIIRYRNQHGPYRQPADLARIRILPQAQLEKMLPYLSFE
jgi:DNA uptake protein ComE-like DNA-binding protein